MASLTLNYGNLGTRMAAWLDCEDTQDALAAALLGKIKNDMAAYEVNEKMRTEAIAQRAKTESDMAGVTLTAAAVAL